MSSERAFNVVGLNGDTVTWMERLWAFWGQCALLLSSYRLGKADETKIYMGIPGFRF